MINAVVRTVGVLATIGAHRLARQLRGVRQHELARAIATPRGVAVSAVTSVLACYAVLSMVMFGPASVLQERIAPAAPAVLWSYAYQNWRLFAPSPLSAATSAHAWARCDDGRITPSLDLSEPGLRELQRHRVLPPRESRTVSGPLLAIFADEPLRYVTYPDVGEPVPEFPGYSEEALARYQRYERVLAEVAVDALAPVCGDGVDAVWLKYSSVPIPGRSGRDAEDVEAEQFFVSGWVSV